MDHETQKTRMSKLKKIKIKNKLLAYAGITPVRNKEWTTFVILALAIALLIVSILYDFIAIRDMETNLALFIIGIIVVIAGITMRVISASILGRYFSLHVEIAPDHELIKKGFYRYIRHPLYTGALLIGIGFVMVFSSFWGLVCFLFVYTPAFVYRLQVEEHYLESRFGEHYLQYKRKTWAMIPLIY